MRPAACPFQPRALGKWSSRQGEIRHIIPTRVIRPVTEILDIRNAANLNEAVVRAPFRT